MQANLRDILRVLGQFSTGMTHKRAYNKGAVRVSGTYLGTYVAFV